MGLFFLKRIHYYFFSSARANLLVHGLIVCLFICVFVVSGNVKAGQDVSNSGWFGRQPTAMRSASEDGRGKWWRYCRKYSCLKSKIIVLHGKLAWGRMATSYRMGSLFISFVLFSLYRAYAWVLLSPRCLSLKGKSALLSERFELISCRFKLELGVWINLCMRSNRLNYVSWKHF